MRLHTLEINAFGPFADPARVDFDALSDAGLFLLSGPTGAGKSSILDAVCFALYGDVPGDRSTAKRLRCDQADEDAAPRVVLEVTLSGRRFRIDRSPAWQRPKRRGTGMTTEQARVVISERTSGDDAAQWRPLSTRLDETGHLVTRLVGMNLPQFCQVAMLPQGRFQAFLRAGSDERHALLQQVFQTGRFDRVESWLRNRRVELRRESQAHQERIADGVSRLSEVTSSPVLTEWESDPTVLDPWSTDLATDTRDRLEACVEALAKAVAAESDAAAREAEGQALAHAISVLLATRAEARRLDEAAAERATVGARIEAARRAEAVRPLHLVSTEAAALAQRAERALDAAVRRVAEVTGETRESEVLPTDLAALRRRAVAGLTEVARVRPIQARSRELATQLRAAEGDLADARHRALEIAESSRSIPGELTALRAAVTEATVAAARVPGLREQLTTLHERRTASVLAEQLADEVARAESERLAAVHGLQVAKETWLDVRERRLDGMAAEIASALVVGGCCPVCGSAEHPSPALPESGAPDVESERSVRKDVDDLEVVVEARTQHVRGLEARLATARATAGTDLARLPRAITEIESALAEAGAAAASLPGLTQDVAGLEQQAQQVGEEHDHATASVSAAAARADRLHREHETVLAEAATVLEGTGCADLDDLAELLRTTEEVSVVAEAAFAHQVEARVACDRAASAADRAAQEAGFESVSVALAAWMGPEDVADLQEWAAAYDRDSRRVRDLLAEEAIRAAGDATPPDLDALARVHRLARQETMDARRAHDLLVERSRRLAGLVAELRQALALWEPLRSELDVVTTISTFVEGKSPDNRLQMRLSAYVLAHRLAQVVDAANLRLATMSDQRFSLVHTGQRGAGERRGGLSLLVRDDWSGESRDPATLSGGETFVVSLALALGLADVITAEAGGADLETLFVDEGFGSLDADTLDDVMDTLDSLRDGGRVVGVVSHVAEMQIRIPTQLRVHKGREGSRVSQ